MLVLSRKKNESIIINDDITIVVVEIRGDKVRLGVEAPKEVPVHRNEVYEAIRRNQQKLDSDDGPNPTSSEAAKPQSPVANTSKVYPSAPATFTVTSTPASNLESQRTARRNSRTRSISPSRKNAISKLRELLVARRTALRNALAGDLSLLQQLRE